MNILVTGGAGYIGSHAVRALANAGHTVHVIDDLSHGHAEAIDKRARFVRLPIQRTRELTALLREERIEAVFHFAARIEVAESVADPVGYYATNFGGGLSLLEAMRAAHVERIIFSSTAAVYGVPTQIPIPETAAREPVNPYGRSKAMMEQALADAAQAYGLAAVGLRYFNVAGAAADGAIGEAHEPESHLIPRVLAAADGAAAAIDVYGTDYPTPDGTAIRDYVHVEDLVAAHLLALKALSPGRFTAFNLGSQKGFSVREVIAVCAEVSGHDIPVRYAARRAGDPPVLVADSTKIRGSLGWKPRYPALREMVEHAWAWRQSHPFGFRPTLTPTAR